MAAAAGTTETKFPGVNVGADKSDSCTLYLKFTGLKTKKKNVIGPLVATNGDVKVTFTTGTISAQVTVRDKDDKATNYEYKKNLPEDIDDKRSSWKIFKDERIEIKLVKAKSGSWERHARYLQTKD